MKLDGKVAIVTGASRGIGRATALLFAREGAKVVVNYASSEKSALDVVDEVERIGSEAVAVKCDISNEDEVREMMEKTIEFFGKVDVLVNNAGIAVDVPFFERSVEQWRRTLDVNLIGTFLCSKYVSERMEEGGNIVNISSTSGIDYFGPEEVDYAASKAGVIVMTKTLAEELAPKIRVNSVAPGWVNTEMNKDLPKGLVEEEVGKVFLKRFAEPEEIARSILFLACDDSGYVNGAVLKVDGGRS